MNPGKYVVFGLGEEQFGLPIENVQQILKSSKVTRIPKAPRDILGLFNLRGATIPIVDTSNVLNVPSDEKGYFLVAMIDGIQAAFLVDQVHRIIDLRSEDIEPTDDLAGAKMSSHCGKTDEGLIVLLEPTACIPMKAIRKVKAAEPEALAA